MVSTLLEDALSKTMWQGTVQEKLNFHASENHLQRFGRGGGACILLRGNAENNTFDIAGSHLVNNSAVWGGGLYIALRDSPASNAISVSNIDFENNSCLLNGGGALSVGMSFFGNNKPTENKGIADNTETSPSMLVEH